MYITAESLCCTYETNVRLYDNYIPIKNVKNKLFFKNMNKIYQTTFILENNTSGVTDSFESTRAVLNDMPHTA